jgi:hypothetical protein
MNNTPKIPASLQSFYTIINKEDSSTYCHDDDNFVVCSFRNGDGEIGYNVDTDKLDLIIIQDSWSEDNTEENFIAMHNELMGWIRDEFQEDVSAYIQLV